MSTSLCRRQLAGVRAFRRALACATAAALCLAACAKYEALPAPAALRTQLQDSNLTVETQGNAGSPEQPVGGSGAGAAEGAKQGFAGSTVAGLGLCIYGAPCIAGLALIALSPIAALVGAVAGSQKAHSEAEVAETNAAITATLADIDFAAELDAALREAQPKDAFAEPASLPAEQEAAATVPPAPRLQLALDVTELKLVTYGSIEPDLALQATVLGRIYDLASGEEVYWRAWRYLGKTFPYFAADDNDGARLREAARQASTTLAQRIVADLFHGTAAIEVGKPGEEGTAWPLAARCMRRGDELLVYDSAIVLQDEIDYSKGRPLGADEAPQVCTAGAVLSPPPSLGGRAAPQDDSAAPSAGPFDAFMAAAEDER